MADVTDAQTDGGMSMPEGKRDVILTEKGLAYRIQKQQALRKAKYKQASKRMKDLQMLMKSKENVINVQSELSNFIKCCDEVEEEHKSVLSFPLPQDEVERQNKWFHTQMTLLCDFKEKVKKWLVDVGQPDAQPNVEGSEHDDDDDDDDDDVMMMMMMMMMMVRMVTKLDLGIVFPTSYTQDMLRLHLKYHVSLQHLLHASRLKLKRQLLWNVLQH